MRCYSLESLKKYEDILRWLAEIHAYVEFVVVITGKPLLALEAFSVLGGLKKPPEREIVCHLEER